jgi:hypothetical protein
MEAVIWAAVFRLVYHADAKDRAKPRFPLMPKRDGGDL